MKTNRIMFAVASDAAERTAIVRNLILHNHLAYTPSAASMLIRPVLDESILREDCYYVAASSVADHLSMSVWKHLFSIANKGIFVAVGVRKLPAWADILGDSYTSNDFPMT